MKIRISLFFIVATLFLSSASSAYSQGQIKIIVNEEPTFYVSKNSPEYEYERGHRHKHRHGHKYGHRKKIKKDELVQVLRLSSPQRVKFMAIINNYESEYSNYHMSRNDGNKIQLLITERDRKIRKVLNEDQYNVYLQFSLDF